MLVDRSAVAEAANVRPCRRGYARFAAGPLPADRGGAEQRQSALDDPPGVRPGAAGAQPSRSDAVVLVLRSDLVALAVQSVRRRGLHDDAAYGLAIPSNAPGAADGCVFPADYRLLGCALVAHATHLRSCKSDCCCDGTASALSSPVGEPRSSGPSISEGSTMYDPQLQRRNRLVII